jgi:hypothetical protein
MNPCDSAHALPYPPQMPNAYERRAKIRRDI